MASLPESSQVLVIGAGPVGLAAAIGLAQKGLQVTIADALQLGQNGSRAAIVHPYTLENLDQLGLSDRLADEGIHAEGVDIRDMANRAIVPVSFTQLKDLTRFPYGLLISQRDVEAILSKTLVDLGVTVHRGKKAVGVRELPDGSGLEVAFESGERVTTKYLVGADGSHSVLRDASEIKFLNPHTLHVSTATEHDTQFVLADVTLQHPLPPWVQRDKPNGYVDSEGILVLAPFGDKHAAYEDQPFRFVTTTSPNHPAPPHEPDLAYVQEILDRRGPKPHVKLTAVRHGSRYRTRSAIAERYVGRRGEAFICLAGDAAHVHSPAGGQGMNLGLCDAVALSAAIAAHAGGDLAALDRYEQTRRAIGLRVIRLAENITKVADWQRSIFAYFINTAISLLLRIPFVNRRVAINVSGLVYRL